jgi:transposase
MWQCAWQRRPSNPSDHPTRTPADLRKRRSRPSAFRVAARVWTLTATAERNGHEPLAYLTDYLDACAEAGGKPPDGTALERSLVWLPAAGSPGDDDAPPGHRPGDGPAP